MTLNDVVFISHLPSLDLHGYDRETARVAICDFIRDQIKQQKEIVLIVHGIGSGIIRKMTHEVLKRHPLVIDYKLYYYNTGCTIVQLKI